MALQWIVLSYIVAVEAAIALILTIPLPKAVKSGVVAFVSMLVQPAISIVPFAGFQLMDIYVKGENRLMCRSEVCTSIERDRYERSIYKAQKNVILCVAACLLYWFAYRICKFHKDIQDLEAAEKRYKDM